MAYLHWNYALALGIETPCIIAVIGVQQGSNFIAAIAEMP